MKNNNENNICFDQSQLDKAKDMVKARGLTYKINTYGCAMNEHDSEQIAGILEEMGFIASNDEFADFILFNTCCVRENAENRLFGNVGALKERKRANPNLRIGVCGCMMQQDGGAESLKKKFPFVDIVFGTHNLQNLPELINRAMGKEKVVEVFDSDGYIVEGMPVKRVNDYSAFINIMYGCNNFCTYCIVPYVRGRERSRDAEEIFKEAHQLAKDGVTQITLLGQNVNSYHKNGDGCSFPELLSMLSDIPGLKRINYLTSHPKDLSDELIDVIANHKNISRHLHLPVQAGDSMVLANMHRGYSREDYIALVDRIRNKVPNIGLTTDIIVGFPGETEEQFENTLELMRQIRFDAVFSFMYNVRKGTKAEKMDNQVPLEAKKERLQRLMWLQKQLCQEEHQKLIGHRFEVFIDKSARMDGQMCGRSMCGKLINVACAPEDEGKYLNVEITGAHYNSLSGKVVE